MRKSDEGTITVTLKNTECKIEIEHLSEIEIGACITALVVNVVEDFPDMRIPLISAIMTNI